MKNLNLLIFPIILFVTIFFTNCSITKRNYRSGYYVTWNKKTVKQEKITWTPIQAPNDDKSLLVSAQKIESSILKRKEFKLLSLNPDTCGDLIVMLNGDERIGKIIEINPKLIKYKNCNAIHDTLETMNIEEIFMVKYMNGTKELFKKAEIKNRPNVSTKIVNTEIKNVAPIKYNKYAIASFATALLSFTIYLSPIPLILGIIGTNQINKDPNKFKGTFMANVGMVLGIIGTIVLLFYRPFS